MAELSDPEDLVDDERRELLDLLGCAVEEVRTTEELCERVD